MIYILFAFYNFLYILPTELFRLFCPWTVPFANHSISFIKVRCFTWSAIRFKNFLKSCTWIYGMPISWKIYDFSFWPVFNAKKKKKKKKKNQRYFAIVEYVIFRCISRCTFIISVLYGYKLFLISYVSYKIRKNMIFCNFSATSIF